MQLFKKKLIDSITAFIKDSKAVGITLLACTFLSLVLSNISFTKELYASFWIQSFTGSNEHAIKIGFLSFPNSIQIIINDFLMSIFFFLAGMEIRRELVKGELSSIKKSIIPVAAAIGGMIVPAILFTQINKGTDNMSGWAIPMATDIAFTLGVASLLGNKVPVSLKVFLTALAIIDDLGAIIVIALFYGDHLKVLYLLLCGLILLFLYLKNKNKKPFGWSYIVLGLALWYCMFNSGIHSTVAGVVFAFFIPINSLEKLESKLHTPVYFLIIPLFALANTAITISVESTNMLNSTLTWGIIVGLCIGKPLGICGSVFYLVKRKWVKLPTNITWNHLIGAGFLAGIGFTMSIFISALAFNGNILKDNVSKIGVLIASLISILAGFFWLSNIAATSPKKQKHTI